ncbi:unnamed protein product [Rotaria sordida]|uniref:Cyclohexanone monooxygenase n=1 Tax=Rotaria sordida TaxID=392033 RepID=A0A814AD84_9BILA|nr:unnamed protein product [Rotaria sordida]
MNSDEILPKMLDAVVVGAGFSGLYMLYCLREQGFSAKILEAGDGIGGTWYWNRYPGARCDVESIQYSYLFSEELEKEWKWSELFASQPEILRYLNYVVDKFDLRKDIQLGTRVNAAFFDETHSRWEIQTNQRDRLFAKFCIMATGCVSATNIPQIKGLDIFNGNHYHTSRWPHNNICFNGRRVAVIGTGSSGIQLIPIIAEQADHVFVFQRTPNFSIPARNGPLNAEYEQIDLQKGSIDEITPNGIRIKEKIYEVDDIVFATGFDAMTGALLQIDIRGRSDKTLRDKWAEGPRTYLGLMVANFPNLFIITGPGSPSVLTNMPRAIEQHVDWIAECLNYLRTHHYDTIEPQPHKNS